MGVSEPHRHNRPLLLYVLTALPSFASAPVPAQLSPNSSGSQYQLRGNTPGAREEGGEGAPLQLCISFEEQCSRSELRSMHCLVPVRGRASGFSCWRLLCGRALGANCWGPGCGFARVCASIRREGL